MKILFFRYVVKKLDPVSNYQVQIRCGCFEANVEQLKFFRVSITNGVFNFAPARSTFDSSSLQFDPNDFDETEGETATTPTSQRNVAKPVSAYECPKCLTAQTVEKITIPETTFILVMEIPKSLQTTILRHHEPPQTIKINDVEYEKAWIQFKKGHCHFVTMHEFDGQWFYFDDMEGKDPAVKHVNNQVYETENLCQRLSMQRIFYYRKLNRNKHRCLEFQIKQEKAERLQMSKA